MCDSLTLDQIETFIAVVDEGSFAAAARRANRSPAAVTYVIQKMESQLNTVLFDRGSYRPTLTAAGLALLPRVRRIADEVSGLRLTASALAQGLEPEVTLVLDSIVSVDLIANVLRRFQSTFPTVRLRIFVETFGTATAMVVDGTADLGIVNVPSEANDLFAEPLLTLETVLIVAAGHDLAREADVATLERLTKHCQVVITDRVSPRTARDYSVFSPQTMRVGDIQTKLAAIGLGLGFGTMPVAMAMPGLAAGQLVIVRCTDAKVPLFHIPLVHRSDRPMGPATRWIYDELKHLAHPK